MQMLKDLWEQFQDGHSALQRAIPEVEKSAFEYFKSSHFDKTEDVYIATMEHMSESLEAMEPFVSESRANRRGNNSTTNVTAPSLPSINMPPFDGSYEKWEHFRDRFSSLIINNAALSEFSRMHYLSSSLSGQALDCISAFPVTADSFRDAWTALKRHFENKRRLLGRHFATLLNSTAVARESASDLQSLCDSVTTTLAAIRNLDRPPAQLWNDIIVYIVSQKLDHVTRKAWKLRTSEAGEPPSLDELTQFLTARAQALEESTEVASARAPPKTSSTRKACNAAAIKVASSGCALYDAKHYVNSCPRFLSWSPGRRREFVKKTSRCFNCLNRNHSTSECRSTYTCRICQERHHILLHAAQDSSSDTHQSASASKATASSALPPPLSPDGGRNVSSLCVATKRQRCNQVLLATAWVTISVPSGRFVRVRALLDQGSEISLRG